MINKVKYLKAIPPKPILFLRLNYQIESYYTKNGFIVLNLNLFKHLIKTF